MLSREELLELKKKVVESMEEHNGLIKHRSDNPVLFTVELYTVLKENYMLDEEDLERLHKAINAVAMRDKDTGKIIKGLYTRRAGTEDDYVRKDQHDNYVGIACTSMFGKEFEKYAEAIDDFGFKHLYHNNRKPKRNNIFTKGFWETIRQGFDIALYRMCCDRWPGIFNILWFYSKIMFEIWDFKKVQLWPLKIDRVSRGYTSSRILSWLRFKAIGHKWYINPIMKYWYKNLYKIYPKGIQEVFEIYHNGSSNSSTLLKELSKRVR